MGFEPLAYKGLETGSREVVSHVIRQDKVESRTSCWEQSSTVVPLSLIPLLSSQILFVFASPLNPGSEGRFYPQMMPGATP